MERDEDLTSKGPRRSKQTDGREAKSWFAMLRKVIGIIYFRYLSGIYFLYAFEGGGFRWVTETREGDTVKSFLQLINHCFSHHHPIESSRTYFITDRKQLSSTASSFLPPLHNPPHFPANKVQTLPKVSLAGDHSPHQPPSGLQTSHQPCYRGKSPPAYHLPLIISQIIHQM